MGAHREQRREGDARPDALRGACLQGAPAPDQASAQRALTRCRGLEGVDSCAWERGGTRVDTHGALPHRVRAAARARDTTSSPRLAGDRRALHGRQLERAAPPRWIGGPHLSPMFAECHGTPSSARSGDISPAQQIGRVKIAGQPDVDLDDPAGEAGTARPAREAAFRGHHRGGHVGAHATGSGSPVSAFMPLGTSTLRR